MNKKAKEEAISTLQEIKSIINDLNNFIVSHNLLKVETLNPDLTKQTKCDATKKLTSVLQISVECDEQIALIEDYGDKQI